MVANAFFRGQSGLVLLIIDPALLKSPVRWEPPHSAGRLPEFTHNSVFPHIYGPINTEAVARTLDLVPNATGSFVLPRPA